MAGVLLLLSLSFNRYLDPADTRWKVPKATLNYVYFSAPAVYTTRHREPFPAKTPLAAAYCGNISTDCKQNGYGLEADYLSDLISVIKHKVLVEDRWFFFFNVQSKYKISCQPKATRAQTATDHNYRYKWISPLVSYTLFYTRIKLRSFILNAHFSS